MSADHRGRQASPDFVCDWCETLIDGEAWEWHATVGHPQCIVHEAVWIWVSRPIEGELPPPIDPAVERSLHADGRCCWCFEPLGDRRSDFNGGTGHPGCARYAYQALAGADAMPWPLAEPGVYEQPAFLERLARAAVKHRLSARRLELAVKEALRG
jgi:hypothetical protein